MFGFGNKLISEFITRFDSQEIEIGLKDCPIAKYIAKLKQSNILSQAESEKFEVEIAEEVSDAFKFALSSMKPSAKDAAERIYA